MPKHNDFMYAALELAQKATCTDDIPVGCVIVHGVEIIATGYNCRERDNNALNHAEVVAIREACEKLNSWRLDGCTLYVTLEPCAMCAGAIVNARISRVVFGAYDPKGGAFGGVFDLNLLGLNHRPEVIGGIMEDECSEVLKEFFSQKR